MKHCARKLLKYISYVQELNCLKWNFKNINFKQQLSIPLNVEISYASLRSYNIQVYFRTTPTRPGNAHLTAKVFIT